MAKWFGEIGYAQDVEETPGVWVNKIIKRNYYGDVTRNFSRWQTGDSVNDDLTVNNQLSIIADPFAMEHFHTMKYAEMYGTKWKITSVEPQYPRLIISIGGVYNGK